MQIGTYQQNENLKIISSKGLTGECLVNKSQKTYWTQINGGVGGGEWNWQELGDSGWVDWIRWQKTDEHIHIPIIPITISAGKNWIFKELGGAIRMSALTTKKLTWHTFDRLLKKSIYAMLEILPITMKIVELIFELRNKNVFLENAF